jgi:hypothetical protein
VSSSLSWISTLLAAVEAALHEAPDLSTALLARTIDAADLATVTMSVVVTLGSLALIDAPVVGRRMLASLDVVVLVAGIVLTHGRLRRTTHTCRVAHDEQGRTTEGSPSGDTWTRGDARA